MDELQRRAIASRFGVPRRAAGRALVATAVFGIAAGSLLLVTHRTTCRSGGTGNSARQAIDRFYRACSPRPDVTYDGDGGKDSTPYAEWHAVEEFTAVYPDHRTRFVLVGQETQDGAWRVLDGEGTGP